MPETSLNELPGDETEYDFIICGAGSSGSVIARRLAENPQVSVLLLEAGGDDRSEAVSIALRWPENLGSSRSWNYVSQPNPNLNGRTMQIDAGKTLGGGSSINVMTWAHGHRDDWNFFFEETGDPAWSYEAIRPLFHRIEDWHGPADPDYRGIGGPIHVEPAQDPNPLAAAMLEAAASIGLPIFPSHNGAMMEGAGGAAILESCIEGDQRRSVFRGYLDAYLNRPNLTILTGAEVLRVRFDGDRATGVEIVIDGRHRTVAARLETILSLGAIQTPAVLMRSGIGDRQELERLGIKVVGDLPGVGRNYQDHAAVDVVWEAPEPLSPRNSMAEAILFARSAAHLAAPDIQAVSVEVPLASAENMRRFPLPSAGWGLFGGNVRPRSRGRVVLTGRRSSDPIAIHANDMADPHDLEVALAAIDLFRAIGNAAPLRRFRKKEVMPGPLAKPAMEDYVRNAARTFYHQCGTAKMGTDEQAVVNGNLRVLGIRDLRIADASIMPRITTGNTMAPCVVIGERAADILILAHSL